MSDVKYSDDNEVDIPTDRSMLENLDGMFYSFETYMNSADKYHTDQ